MINELIFSEIKIPFKIHFKHNTAKRSETQSVLVRAKSDNNIGYGEGCPREYVTNESIASALAFFNDVQDDVISEIVDLDTLKSFKTLHHSSILKNHSIWCAIEMALLDLFAKQHNCTVESLLDLPELGASYYYSAVVGGGSLSAFKEVVQKHLQIGFTDFKIKIGGNKEVDFEKLLYLKEVSKDSTIRLDANNIWQNCNDAIKYINDLPIHVGFIEEPLVSRNIQELIELSLKISPTIILDESFCSIEQLPLIKDLEKQFVINLRVSKMGGILNSLAIVQECANNNIPLIVGAQVGETSILTRAALTVCCTPSAPIIHQEGAYGTLLLESDLINPSMMFGKKGILNPSPFLNQNVNGFQLYTTDIQQFINNIEKF